MNTFNCTFFCDYVVERGAFVTQKFFFSALAEIVNALQLQSLKFLRAS